MTEHGDQRAWEDMFHAFYQGARSIVNDPGMGVEVAPHPAPLVAVITVAWRPRGDPEAPWRRLVRRVQRDPDPHVPMLDQVNYGLCVVLAELQLTVERPTVH